MNYKRYLVLLLVIISSSYAGDDIKKRKNKRQVDIDIDADVLFLASAGHNIRKNEEFIFQAPEDDNVKKNEEFIFQAPEKENKKEKRKKIKSKEIRKKIKSKEMMQLSFDFSAVYQRLAQIDATVHDVCRETRYVAQHFLDIMEKYGFSSSTESSHSDPSTKDSNRDETLLHIEDRSAKRQKFKIGGQKKEPKIKEVPLYKAKAQSFLLKKKKSDEPIWNRRGDDSLLKRGTSRSNKHNS